MFKTLSNKHNAHFIIREELYLNFNLRTICALHCLKIIDRAYY